MRLFKVKPNVNKKNKSINITLPKKKLSKKLRELLDGKKIKTLKLKVEDYDEIL